MKLEGNTPCNRLGFCIMDVLDYKTGLLHGELLPKQIQKKSLPILSGACHYAQMGVEINQIPSSRLQAVMSAHCLQVFPRTPDI